MIAPYWGGAGASLGSVRPLAVNSFASFVKEVLASPVLVGSLTRAEFQALPKAERSQRKRVAFATPAAFRTNHRIYEDADHCNLIFLDIDEPSQAKPFIDRPEALAERLAPFAFAAYTTASSTPTAPRLRIVVSGQAIPVATYADAVRWVGENLLGLPRVNPESRVAVQPMFLPTLFRGDDPLSDHPLIIAVPEGAAVTAGSVVGVAPSGNPLPIPTDTDPDAALLEFLRPQIEGVTLEDVTGALVYLDPDCAYLEWVEVAAAMRHQFPAEAEEAFAVFNRWSRTGTKYTTEEETRAKWDSFKTNPRGRAPITVRSLLRRAADAGWNQAQFVAERCYNEVLAWVRSCSSSAQLLQQGVVRIAGTPLISPLQEGNLLSELFNALKEANVNVPRSELKANLSKVKRDMVQVAAPKPTPDAQMPKWARGICYVANQNTFFQRHTGRAFKPEVVDSYFGVQLMTSADAAKGAPAILPQDYLLNILKCPRVDDYIYSPAHDGETFVQLGHKRAVNLYIPTHPEPDTATAAAAGEVFQEHIGRLIAEPDYQKLLIDYLAYHVQQPGRKIRWATLIQGAQGCGKTVLAEAMRAVLGAEHVRSIGAELLFTDFTGWKTGSQLCAIEEIRVVGHNRYEVMNKLKDAISNDFVTVNEKNLRAYMTANVTNYVMFTNHHDSIAIADGDRRYFILNSPLQAADQVREMGVAYFDRLWNVVRHQAGGLRSWLEQWPIGPEFNPDGHAPMTRYLSELADASATPLQAAVQEAIENREHPLVAKDLVSMTTLRHLLSLQHGLDFTDQTLGAVLREQGYLKSQRHSVDGERQQFWVRARAQLNVEAEIAKRLCLLD